MGRKPSAGLTWRDDGRWCKQYRGRWFYFSGKELGKTRSEPLAKAAYKQWRLQIDNELAQDECESGSMGLIQRERDRLLQEYPDTLETRLHFEALGKLAEHALRKPGPETTEDFIETASMIARLASTFAQFPKGATISGPVRTPSAQMVPIDGPGKPPKLCVFDEASKSWVEVPRTTAIIATPPQPPGVPPWQTGVSESDKPDRLSGLVAKFMGSLEHKVSPVRFEKVRLITKRFLEQIGDVRLDQLTSSVLLAYRDSLLQPVNGRKRAPVTVRDNLVAIRQMISWGYRAELIDQVPRALEREWTVPIAIGEVKPAGVSEIQDLLKVASPRERLYVLLGLNLGYGPRDISALRHDEIDWASGLVTRQRTKTKRFQNSPTISYQLWPEVLQLLKEFRSNHETLALTTIHGAPLVQDKHRVDGSLIRSDAIHSAWVRLCRKVEKPIQLKQLRKTSASLLANHPTHSRWVDHFLGHVPKSMAAKHYVKLDETPFHEALRWLRSQYLGYPPLENLNK